MKRWGLVCAFLLLAPAAYAYVDISPSLGYIVEQAEYISVLQVEKVNLEKKAVLFKKVADIKGKGPAEVVRHHLAEGFHPREPRIVLEWAEPGKTAIAFTHGKISIVCIGRYWYQVGETSDGWWAMTTGRPELALAFYGRADQLREGVAKMVAGEEVVLTAVNHGARSGVWQYQNVAFQKVLRGRDCPVWRIKASLKMPDSVWMVGDKDSPWIVGPGVAGPDEIQGLVAILKDKTKDSRARSRAAIDLGLTDWQGRPALPALEEACHDDEPLVRVQAAKAVGLITDEFTKPGLILQEALKDDKPAVRKQAAIALGDFGAGAKGAVVALRKSLTDPDPSVRWSVAEALGRIGANAAPAVPGLAEALRDPAIRGIAADALGGIGPGARGAAPLLVDALSDPDADFRWTSAVALTRIDSKSAKAALPMFIEKLKSPDLRARWDTLMYITPMRADAKACAPEVQKMVERGNGVAAATLAAIAGPEAEIAIPVLIYVLADDWDTCESLYQIGKASVPPLLAMLKEEKLKHKHHLTVKALGMLAPKSPDCLPAVLDALKRGEPKVRRAAADALGALEGKPGKLAIEPLRAALKDSDPLVKLAVAQALRNLHEDSHTEALQAMVLLLGHEKAMIRRDAATSLAEFGADAHVAIDALNRQKEDKDAGVRSAVAVALARISTAHTHKEAIKVMIGALKDPDPRARQDAARFLGTMGSEAKIALAALTDARHDDDEDVRRLATEALTRIR